MFEILVNGIARSYRDQEDMAIDAGRLLRARDKSEIVLINLDTRQWLMIVDPFADPRPWRVPVSASPPGGSRVLGAG